MICSISQSYKASGLTGPWRLKLRPPWGLSANPGAWHGLTTERSHPGAMDGYDMLPPRAISVTQDWDEENVFC